MRATCLLVTYINVCKRLKPNQHTLSDTYWNQMHIIRRIADDSNVGMVKSRVHVKWINEWSINNTEVRIAYISCRICGCILYFASSSERSVWIHSPLDYKQCQTARKFQKEAANPQTRFHIVVGFIGKVYSDTIINVLATNWCNNPRRNLN